MNEHKDATLLCVKLGMWMKEQVT